MVYVPYAAEVWSMQMVKNSYMFFLESQLLQEIFFASNQVQQLSQLFFSVHKLGKAHRNTKKHQKTLLGHIKHLTKK